MPKRSDYDIRQEASMSQQLAAIDEDYIDLAGSDPETSLSIQTLKDLQTLGLIKKDDPAINMMLVLLNGRRKAFFATNEKSSDVTKLGLQMPKSPKVYGSEEDERKKS